MATYRTIASTETDAASPVTTTLMSALADNPTAIAEGTTGAPRLYLRALERLEPGSQVRAEFPDRTINIAPGDFDEQFLTLSVIQGGEFTLAFQFSQSVSWTIERTRSGTTASLSGGATSGGVVVTQDTECLPGDVFILRATGTVSGGSAVDVIASNMEIRTDGQDLWPSQGLWGNISNNRGLT